MEGASESVELMRKMFMGDVPVKVGRGLITKTDESIHFVPGIGLMAEVVLTMPTKVDGVKVKAIVSGELFSAASGALFSDPVAPGEHVVVLFAADNPNAGAIIVGRASSDEDPPPKQVAFRNINAANLRLHYFRKTRPKADWYEEHEDGNVFINLIGTKGNYVIKAPDGSSISIEANVLQPIPGMPPLPVPLDVANGPGNLIKLKQSGGSTVVLTGRGVQIESPSGNAMIQVTDAGITLRGPFVKTMGPTFLNMGPSDVAGAATQAAVMGGPPGGTSPGGSASLPFKLSAGVFIGAGV